MTDPHSITCADCQSRLEEFALGELTGGARDQLASHLDTGCEPCNSRLAQIVAGLAQLPSVLPPSHPPSRVEQALMTRLAAERRRRVAPTNAVAEMEKNAPSQRSRGLIAAAIALAAGLTGIAAWINWQGHAPVAPANGSGRQFAEWTELRRRMEDAERTHPLPLTPRLEFVSVRSVKPETQVHGFTVTDALTRQWHVYVFNLPVLAENRQYQLWFVSPDSQFVSAGMVDVDENAAVSTVVDLPTDLTPVVGLAISDEAQGGADQPTGEYFFQAEIPQEHASP